MCTDVASRGVDPDVSMNENRTHPPSLIYKGMETFSLNNEGGGHVCASQFHLAEKRKRRHSTARKNNEN